MAHRLTGRRAAVIVLAIAALVALAVAVSGPAKAVTLPDHLADQQDVHTDGTGTVTVRFDQGDEELGAGNDTCMSGSPVVVFQLAATLTAGKPQPVTFRARFNNACSIRLTILDGNGNPITNADVRVAYLASVKGAYDLTPAA
jgi:hypothetical protein